MEMFNYFKMIETVYGLFVVFHYDISMPWLDQSLDFKSTFFMKSNLGIEHLSPYQT